MAGDNPSHLAFLRTLGCANCGAAPPSTAHHHTGGRGMSQRSSDNEAFPLCAICHDDFHRGLGAFWGWSKWRRRAWQDRMVVLFRPRAFDPEVF